MNRVYPNLSTPIEPIQITLPQLLLDRATRYGKKVAFREKDLGIWKQVSWEQYRDCVLHFAVGLSELGVQKGDFVAIAGEGVPEWMYSDVAAQSLGAISVGLYPTSPWPEIAFVLKHCQARVVVCGDQEQADKIFDALQEEDLPNLTHIIVIDMKGMRNYRDKRLRSFTDILQLGQEQAKSNTQKLDAVLSAIECGQVDDTSIIVYTSGTTGNPKGAMLSHCNLTIAAKAVLDEHGFDQKNLQVLCYLPLCHVAERSFSTTMHLISGSIINFSESFDTVTENLREIAPTLFLGVPRIWEKLQHTIETKIKEAGWFNQTFFYMALALAKPIAERQLASDRVRVNLRDRAILFMLWVLVFRNLQRFSGLHRAKACFCGAASVSPSVLLFFKAIGLPIYQVYGMTETSAVAFQQLPGKTTLGAVGVPIDALEFKLADDGELLMRGPSIFKGYLHNEAATKATFGDGWLCSGDIARVLENGEISIVDRKKEIIVTSGGKNIAPSEVENALKESLFVREAIVVGEGRNYVAALIQIDYDAVGKWAQESGLTFTNYKSLAALSEVRALISDLVKAANKRFATVSQVRRFLILSKELDHDDGELTATMKVKRSAIEKKFSEEIEQLYGKEIA